VAPTTNILVGLTGVPGPKFTAPVASAVPLALHLTSCFTLHFPEGNEVERERRGSGDRILRQERGLVVDVAVNLRWRRIFPGVAS